MSIGKIQLTSFDLKIMTPRISTLDMFNYIYYNHTTKIRDLPVVDEPNPPNLDPNILAKLSVYSLRTPVHLKQNYIYGI